MQLLLFVDLVLEILSQASFWTVGLAMSAWGEFAFILAASAFDMKLISETDFAALVLAVTFHLGLHPQPHPLSLKKLCPLTALAASPRLNGTFCTSDYTVEAPAPAPFPRNTKRRLSRRLQVLFSVVISPVLLRRAIASFNREAERRIEAARRLPAAPRPAAARKGVLQGGDALDERSEEPPVCYMLRTRSMATWGLSDRLGECMRELGLSVLDFRSHQARSPKSVGSRR